MTGTLFSVEMLAASEGDCLWIEYGDPQRPARILIDGGTSRTWPDALLPRLERLAEDDRRFELLVVTHVDADHIGGVLQLLDERPLGVNFGEVWFNAWRHIERVVSNEDRLGPVDGEILSTQLDAWGGNWNATFDGGPAALAAGDAPREITLPGGMRLTVLSPDSHQLTRLRDRWEEVVRAAGLEPGTPAAPLAERARRKGVALEIDDRLGEGSRLRSLAEEPYEEDESPANGSTIALLAEFGGASVLLGGDAYASVLRSSVRALLDARGYETLSLDAFKLPHHGSGNNIDNNLLAMLRCDRYLFSTSGAKYHHPDEVAVARVLTHGGRRPRLVFNYRNERTGKWVDRELRDEFEYEACYPPPDAPGYRIDLLGGEADCEA